MSELKLGYTEKWFDYSFLDEETLLKQITEFEKEDENKAEDFRLASFKKWLEGKKELTDEEVNDYMELAQNDADERVSGSAMTDLFVSTKISDQQFEVVKNKLPQFGDWTEKIITREVLTKRINGEILTVELFNLCYKYKADFNDNRLLIGIIKKTDSPEFLSMFANMEVGKKIKTLAKNKLNQIEKIAIKN